MENKRIQTLLLEAIENKLSGKQNLAIFISETLNIEKEAAYRRIRGCVPFNLKEAAIISRKLNISLDDVIRKSESEGIVELLMHPPQHYHMGLQEPWHVEQDVNFLEQLTKEPYSEMGVALSGISSSLYYYYSYLARFYLLKYRYSMGDRLPYRETQELPQQIKYRKDFYRHYHNMSNTYYIWDRRIMGTLVDDINYFHSLQLMSDEDIEAVKNDLYRFLNDLNLFADKGYYPDTGKRFELYVSDSSIDVTYAYMWSEKVFVSMYTSFVLLTTSSMEKIPFQNVSEWIKSLRRSSEQISLANERERILFFKQQKDIVDSLGK